MPDIVLNREAPEPLYQQIRRQLAEAIRGGRLGRGERLPSTRKLAALLGVSRNIVIIAYENLAADGLIRTMHGSGARVTDFAPVTFPPIGTVLKSAMYPECVTLFSDYDGNPLYLRHPHPH